MIAHPPHASLDGAGQFGVASHQRIEIVDRGESRAVLIAQTNITPLEVIAPIGTRETPEASPHPPRTAGLHCCFYE